MPVYERMHSVEELPDKRPHFTHPRMRRKAATVYRNTQQGHWTKYAAAKSKSSLFQAAWRMRRHPVFTQYGHLDVEYRYEEWHRMWIMFVRFAPEILPDVTVTDDEVLDDMETADLEVTNLQRRLPEPEPVPPTREELEAWARAEEEKAAEQAERLDWISRGLVQGGFVVDTPPE